jgi:hydroxyethylthiazole kinase-like uncharacterized protein yjeF
LKSVDGLVYVSADEMRRIDERTIEGYFVDVLSLMENAGLCTAVLARRMLAASVKGKRIACLAGKGNNGGDGLVAARHLHNWGADVTIVLAAQREALTGMPAKQIATLEKMGLPISATETSLAGFSLLIDELLGYNTKGDPREPIASMIRMANNSGVPILALDLPSGLDPTTGGHYEPCIEAKVTITLALPKIGFLAPEAKKYIGELYLADISIPAEVYAEYSQPAGIFDQDQLAKVW